MNGSPEIGSSFFDGNCDPVIFNEMKLVSNNNIDPILINAFAADIPAEVLGFFIAGDHVYYHIKLFQKPASYNEYEILIGDIKSNGRGIIEDVIVVKPPCSL